MTCMCDREKEYCNLWNLHSFVSEFCDLYFVVCRFSMSVIIFFVLCELPTSAASTLLLLIIFLLRLLDESYSCESAVRLCLKYLN